VLATVANFKTSHGRVEAMTEHQRKTFWSILVCLAIVTLIGPVAVQQSWVKRRPIGIAPQRPQPTLVSSSRHLQTVLLARLHIGDGL
jgi:hypothetical protein